MSTADQANTANFLQLLRAIQTIEMLEQRKDTAYTPTGVVAKTPPTQPPRTTNMNDTVVVSACAPPVRATVTNTLAEHKFTVPSVKPTATITPQQHTSLYAQALISGLQQVNNNHRKNTSADTTATSSSGDTADTKELRKTFTLDLSSRETVKKSLTTPDILQLLQTPNLLKTPELQKLFDIGEVQVQDTPTLLQVLCPKDVSTPERNYAKGFADALRHLHQKNGFASPTPTSILTPGLVVRAVQEVEQKDHSPRKPVSLPGSSQTSPSAFSPAKPSADRTAAGDVHQQTIAQLLSALLTPTPTTQNGQSSLPANLLFVLSPQAQQNKAAAGTSLQAVAASMLAGAMNPHGPYYHHQHTNQPPQFGNQQHQQHAGYTMHNTTSAYNMTGEQPPPPAHTIYAACAQQPYAYDTMASSSQQSAATYTVLPVPTTQLINSRPMSSGRVSALAASTSQRMAQSPTPSETSSNMSSFMPLDPDAQDAAKSERKRERNRLAATKCRERKLQRIQALEVEVKIEQTTEAQLQTQMQQLRSDIERLEEVLREHRKRGCTDIGEMKPTKMRKM